jgi:hypothetical protein
MTAYVLGHGEVHRREREDPPEATIEPVSSQRRSAESGSVLPAPPVGGSQTGHPKECTFFPFQVGSSTSICIVAWSPD